MNDTKANLLSQLPASTKVETILKTEPPDPEAGHLTQQVYPSGTGGGAEDFFPEIETNAAAGGPMHSLDDEDFFNSVQPVVGQNSGHSNIKKEVDAFNEYQVRKVNIFL